MLGTDSTDPFPHSFPGFAQFPHMHMLITSQYTTQEDTLHPLGFSFCAALSSLGSVLQTPATSVIQTLTPHPHIRKPAVLHFVTPPCATVWNLSPGSKLGLTSSFPILMDHCPWFSNVWHLANCYSCKLFLVG